MENLGAPNGPEKEPRKFHWRDYVQHPGELSEHTIAALDTLLELLQTDPEAGEFLAAVRRGEYRSQTAAAFVNFFRSALSTEERSKLLQDIKRSGPTGYMESGL